jgi:hypothetical protein
MPITISDQGDRHLACQAVFLLQEQFLDRFSPETVGRAMVATGWAPHLGALAHDTFHGTVARETRLPVRFADRLCQRKLLSRDGLFPLWDV